MAGWRRGPCRLVVIHRKQYHRRGTGLLGNGNAGLNEQAGEAFESTQDGHHAGNLSLP